MIGKLRRLFKNLHSNISGNALMLVGIGLPAFVGSAGLAVDAAQWYQWKRELQFAVDQGALAGAYARANQYTKSNYASRATQEYDANLTTISSFADSSPSVVLSDYNHGTLNSVIVRASATKRLPFSGFLIGRSVTVKAMAQASFTDGNLWTSCLIAVDPSESGAITISGDSLLVARCGLAALSTSDTSVIVNGTPTLDVGWVVSQGGIDDYFNDIPDTTVNEYLTDLFDPFSNLTAPTNSTPQTYSCKTATSSTTTGTDTTTVTTQVYTGDQRNNLTLASSTVGPQQSPVSVNRPSLATDQNGTYTTTSTTTGMVADNGNGANPRYTRTDYVASVDHNYTMTVTTTLGGTMNPGTYVGGVRIGCDTVMNPGIYVMDGGDFQTNAQYTVTGSGVMIVLKNSAGIVINGGANINLTAMTTSQLEAAGVPSSGTTNSSNLAGMLVFEDRNSAGVADNHNRINGNAGTLLNGTIYLPVSATSFAGTASVSSQCLMIAARMITLEGTLDMTTFCPPGTGGGGTVVSSGVTTVRLVA